MTVESAPNLLESCLVHYARHFPIRRGKLRIVDALWRLAARDDGHQRTACLTHGDYRMHCNLDQMLQRQYYFFGTYFLEQENLSCWEAAARSARVAFDVGANAGIYSLCALAASTDAVVHAFEPTPEIAAHLRETAALNGLSRLHVHEMAVARTEGRATLWRCGGDSGRNEGMNFITVERTGSGEEVATVSIDRFCAVRAIERIDVLKLDIQGNEPEALAGAARMLSGGSIGTIFVELNWAAAPGAECSASRTVKALALAGYWFARPSARPEWRSAGDWLASLTDVMARRPQ